MGHLGFIDSLLYIYVMHGFDNIERQSRQHEVI